MVFIKGQIPWNKGVKTGLVPKSAFKKGHLAPKSAFKKGHIPWSKSQKGVTLNTGRTHFKKGQNKGERNCNWKGGKPICIDCGKQLSNYGYKRCHRCSNKLKMSDPKYVKKILRRRKMSSLEEKTNNIIAKYKLPYKFVGNGEFMIENKNPDFINTNGEKKAVEVYYRRHKEQFRDISINKWMEDRKNLFNKYGWKLIFIEANNVTEKNLLNVLKGGD